MRNKLMTNQQRKLQIEKNTIIEEILKDKNFSIQSASHRKGLREVFTEDEMCAMEDFLKHRNTEGEKI